MKEILNYWWLWLLIIIFLNVYVCIRRWPIWKTMYWQDTGLNLLELLKTRFLDCLLAEFAAVISLGLLLRSLITP